jgi:DNA-directed RNA polymerase subunit M/transcription elongation factor TFIIS
MFCPKCNGIWDISKKIPKVQSVDTPKDNEENINKIFQLINKKKYSELPSLITNINIEQIIQHELYAELSKQEKSIINDLFKKVDNTIASYLVCKNCNYSEHINKTLLISTKENYEYGGGSKYNNRSYYKYKPYSSILRRTRYYNCPNVDCKSHTDITKKKAVFDKENDSNSTYYICNECKTVWNISNN